MISHAPIELEAKGRTVRMRPGPLLWDVAEKKQGRGTDTPHRAPRGEES